MNAVRVSAASIRCLDQLLFIKASRLWEGLCTRSKSQERRIASRRNSGGTSNETYLCELLTDEVGAAFLVYVLLVHGLLGPAFQTM